MSLSGIVAAPRPRTAGRAMPGRRSRRRHRLLGLFSTAVLLLVCWAFLAPPVLGGRNSYVITDGISMLPKFHAGDLVILREESSYHVGEVAGYHNGQLGVVVMHRIVAINDGHYEFKGDNNDFTDSYHPTKRQIVGAEWLHLAGVGKYVEKLRAPVPAAVLLAVLGLYAFSPRRRTRRQRKRHRHA